MARKFLSIQKKKKKKKITHIYDLYNKIKYKNNRNFIKFI